MQAPVNCWSCGNSVEQIHFCENCHSLQPPTTEYYDFFGLEHRLDLDLEELERRYYALSRRLHPDVYFRRSPRERQFSLDATAILNDAYRTLRDPIARAGYLLKQNGLEPGDGKVPPELIEEVFEWNLALEEADGAQIEEARRKFAVLVEECDRELASRFQEYDRTGAREVLAEIGGVLSRRRYLEKLLARA